MPLLTHRIMQSVDYTNVAKTRVQNFKCLNELLKEAQIQDIKLPSGFVPMIYPLYRIDTEIRNQLVRAGVYVPQWWKYLLDDP